MSLYRDIFGAIHRYFQILYHPISNKGPSIQKHTCWMNLEEIMQSVILSFYVHV